MTSPDFNVLLGLSQIGGAHRQSQCMYNNSSIRAQLQFQQSRMEIKRSHFLQGLGSSSFGGISEHTDLLIPKIKTFKEELQEDVDEWLRGVHTF